MMVAGSLVAAVLLSGCDGLTAAATHPATLTFAAVNGASVVASDKTVPDHIVSLVTGQDCSLVRYSDGGYYCVQRPVENVPVETRLYCYRSLGGITCYDQPVPGDEGRLVTDPRHVVSSRALAGPEAPRPGSN